MLWQLVLVAAALGWAYYRWSRRRLYQLARKIPSGLKEYPIVGHIYLFRGSDEDQMRGIQKLGQTANGQGGLSSLWLGYKFFICMTDPKSIELVTKTCLDKDDFFLKCMRTVTGNGSIFAPVNIWHQRRKIIAPFFRSKNLTHAVEIFNKQSLVMTELMRSQVGGGDFSMWQYMTAFTLDTIFQSAAEIKTEFQKNPDNFVLRTIHELAKIVCARMLRPWLHPDFIYERLPIYKRFLEIRQQGYDFVDELIRNKRRSVAKIKQEGTRIKKDGLASMFDVVMHSSEKRYNKGYSDVELREEAIVLCVAGNDTSAVGLSFAAVMLSRYPDVQDKVYQELQEVFGDSDREVTAEDLPKLKYLEAVIKENMRLNPPVPIIAREVRNDVVLPSGTTLVKGTSIVINIWGTHRNPAYWGADAELFRPERFLEGPLPHPAMYIPFSYSSRDCIGSTYAMFIAKTGLANLLRRYKLLPPVNMAAAELKKPLRVRYEVMMKNVDNYIVRVEERKKVK